MIIKKLVFGFGVNDSNKSTKVSCCPYYKRWYGMIKRCYSKIHHKTHPTYKDCTVCDEWLIFSNFKNWMVKQDWKGKHLDKDIAITGNKKYSPESCLFIEQEINKLLTDCRSLRGEHPKGVYFDKVKNKFIARCRINKKQKHLGYFSTPKEASEAYKDFKSKLITNVAHQQKEPLKGYLMRISTEFKP